MNTALSNIQKTYEALNDFKKAMSDGGLTDSLLNNIAGLSDNLNNLVAGFYAGIVSADELYAALKDHYNTDLKNYSNALIAKNANNEQFYNATILANKTLVDKFSDHYNTDITNCKTYNEAKLKIENATIKALSSGWAKYYNVQSDSFTAEYQNMMELASKNSDTLWGRNMLDNSASLQRAVNSYREQINALNDIAYSGISASFSTISSKIGNNSSSGSGSEKDSSKIFDWLEVNISRIQEKIDRALKKAESSATKMTDILSSGLTNAGKLSEKYYKDAVAYYKKVINYTTTQRDIESSAASAYMNKAKKVGNNAVSDGTVSQKFVTNVMKKLKDGTLDITEYSDKKLTVVEGMKEWYDKSIECSDAIEDLNEKLYEYNTTLANLPVEQATAKIEKLADSLNIISSVSDIAGTGNYKTLLNVATQDRSQATARLAGAKEAKQKADAKYAKSSSKADLASAKLSQSLLDKRDSKTGLISTKGLKGKELKNVKAYNSAVKKANADYAKVKSANTRVSESRQYVNAANAKLSEIQQYGGKNGDVRSYVSANKALDQSTKNAREQKNVQYDALVKAQKNVTDAQNAYNNAVKKYGKSSQEAKDADANLVAMRTALETATINATQADIDYANTLVDNAKAKFENIQSYYENERASIEQYATAITNAQNLQMEKGYRDSTSYYESLIANEEDKRESLVAERNKLQARLNKSIIEGVPIGSKKYMEMVQSIYDVQNAIDECDISVAKFNNSILELKWDNFDKMQTAISGIAEEADWLINELSRKDLVVSTKKSDVIAAINGEDTLDLNGRNMLTAQGEAVAALHASKYEVYMRQADEYKKQIQDISQQLVESPYSEKLLNQKKEYEEEQRKSIALANDEKEAYIDMYKQAYEAQKSYMQSVMDTYKELLSEQNSAIEYQKTLNSLIKNIGATEKQLSIYGSDNSEENRAKTQKLQKTLEEQRENLADQRREKITSDIGNMFDDLTDSYGEYVDDVIKSMDDNFESLAKSMDMQGIANTISDSMGSFGKEFAGISTILKSSDLFTGTDTAVNNVISGQSALTNAADNNANTEIAGKETEASNADIKDDALVYIMKNAYDAKAKKSHYTDINQKIYELTNGRVLNRPQLKELGKIVGVSIENKKDMDNYTKSAPLYKRLHELGINGFRKGSKYVTKDQIAITQEDGQELIWSAENKGIFTPIGTGYKIFTKEMSDNLWRMSLGELPQNNIISNLRIPDRNSNVTINMGGVELNGVEDPQQFLSQLKHVIKTDRSVKKLIQNETIGTLDKNYNSLSGRKF